MTFASSVDAASIQFQSRNAQASLLEFYTSEGCSSCPPAEKWMTQFADAPGLWTDFVPVTFHVDYWDHLGWRDRWASLAYSNRQRTYAQAWNSDTVYTPGFVLNGREWRGWAKRTGLPPTSEDAGVLSAGSSNGRDWILQFTPKAPGARYEFHAALLACGLTSEVKAGENRGRRLEHSFVVTAFAEKETGIADGVVREVCALTPEFKLSKERLAVAVWVTQTGKLIPIQATGGWLTAAQP
ncbi:MAG: DUF1223 domain-containing protein [Verrucomicrobiales bacterium]|nr:DUF1223 domain-containing protein [Verrucomicrobiales bacterium]